MAKSKKMTIRKELLEEVLRELRKSDDFEIKYIALLLDNIEKIEDPVQKRALEALATNERLLRKINANLKMPHGTKLLWATDKTAAVMFGNGKIEFLKEPIVGINND